MNVIDRGMPVQAAIEAPRFALEAKPNFYKPGAAVTVEMESRFPAELIGALGNMGHKIERVGPYAIGSIQGILVEPGGERLGGADARRMGYAIGY